MNNNTPPPKPKPKSPKSFNAKVWVSTTTLAADIGCCQDTLHRLRERGFLKENIHWRVANPVAQRLTYRWHLKNCRTVWEVKADADG